MRLEIIFQTEEGAPEANVVETLVALIEAYKKYSSTSNELHFFKFPLLLIIP